MSDLNLLTFGVLVTFIACGGGYVMLRDGWPPLNFFVSGEWTVHRENAPVAPQTTLRLGVTVAFPDWRPW